MVPRPEHRDRHPFRSRPERHLHRHPDPQRALLAVDDLRHHARALGEVDDRGDVGDAAAERRQVVAVHDRPCVERGPAARLLPGDVLAPAARTELARVVMGRPARPAAADQQAPFGGRVPVGPGEGVGLGKVEARLGAMFRAHERSPIALSGAGTKRAEQGRGPGRGRERRRGGGSGRHCGRSRGKRTGQSRPAPRPPPALPSPAPATQRRPRPRRTDPRDPFRGLSSPVRGSHVSGGDTLLTVRQFNSWGAGCARAVRPVHPVRP